MSCHANHLVKGSTDAGEVRVVDVEHVCPRKPPVGFGDTHWQDNPSKSA